MRHILQGFTMYVDGSDFGVDTEEVDLPLPTPVTQEYRGGSMDLAVALPMSALEVLECTVKLSGLNPDLLGKIAQGPGILNRLTFRGAVLREQGGGVSTHVCVIEGAINAGSRDRWQRGEKVGTEFVVNGIRYMRYEADSQVVHEVQAFPPKRIINGINQIGDVNTALGY